MLIKIVLHLVFLLTPAISFAQAITNAHRFVPGRMESNYLSKKSVIDTTNAQKGAVGYYVKLKNFGIFLSYCGSISILEGGSLVSSFVPNFNRGICDGNYEIKRTLIESKDDFILFISVSDSYLKARKQELVELSLTSGKYRILCRGKKIENHRYSEDFNCINFVCDGKHKISTRTNF